MPQYLLCTGRLELLWLSLWPVMMSKKCLKCTWVEWSSAADSYIAGTRVPPGNCCNIFSRDLFVSAMCPGGIVLAYVYLCTWYSLGYFKASYIPGTSYRIKTQDQVHFWRVQTPAQESIPLAVDTSRIVVDDGPLWPLLVLFKMHVCMC